MPKRRQLMRRMGADSGFTLVEILVVMLIIGLLAAIAVPSFLGQRDKAHDASAKTSVRTAATAIETFRTDQLATARNDRSRRWIPIFSGLHFSFLCRLNRAKLSGLNTIFSLCRLTRAKLPSGLNTIFSLCRLNRAKLSAGLNTIISFLCCPNSKQHELGLNTIFFCVA